MIIERKRINLKNLPNPSPARALSSRKNPYHRKLSKNPDFLTEITTIMDQAKQFSSVLTLSFRKITDKPEKQLVYVEAPKIQHKLQQMQARISTNKYQTVVQVRKDALDAHSGKKKVGKDLIQQKNYNSIYTEYLKNSKKPNHLQNNNNPTTNSQNTNQDQEIQLGQELKNKLIKSRKVIKQKQNKKEDIQLKKTEEETLATSTSLVCNQEDSQSSRMYELIAIRNHMYGNYSTNLRPQTIMANRMQRKFYRCKQKNMENMFDRLNNDRVESQPYFQTLDMKRTASEKKKNINSLILESCKRIYKQQNKILQRNLKRGLSKENTKSLIAEFNKTILDMKAHTIEKTTRKSNSKQKSKKGV